MGDVTRLRALIDWHSEYRPEWDSSPDLYESAGVVGWGKSRRLGLLRVGRVKAYLGVQHVDPDEPGWRILDATQARFFVSLFVSGQVVTLRTFPTVREALEWLTGVVRGE